jgi:hypothetical protein
MRSISEIIDDVIAAPTKDEKIAVFRKNDNVALKILLKMWFDKNLRWALPEGAPPYKPCEFPDQQAMLYQEVKRLYLFHEGGNPNLKPLKREQMFIQLLESMDPKDAKLLLQIKDKKVPKGISEKLVKESFPGLLVY